MIALLWGHGCCHRTGVVDMQKLKGFSSISSVPAQPFARIDVVDIQNLICGAQMLRSADQPFAGIVDVQEARGSFTIAQFVAQHCSDRCGVFLWRTLA